MSRAYISDYCIVIGHFWYCPDCRREFMNNPHAMLKGLKLTQAQYDRLLQWAAEPTSFMDKLGSESGLDPEAFQQAISHPRARLRHLGVQKRSLQS